MRGIGLILYITVSYKYRLIPNIFLFIPGLCYILLYVIHLSCIHCSRETRYCAECIARVIWIYSRSIRISLYHKRY